MYVPSAAIVWQRQRALPPVSMTFYVSPELPPGALPARGNGPCWKKSVSVHSCDERTCRRHLEGRIAALHRLSQSAIG